MLYHVSSPYFKAYLASTRMNKAKEQAMDAKETKQGGDNKDKL